MSEKLQLIDVSLLAEKIIYSFQDALKSYKKLRLKGEGTRDYHYLINVPRLYVGEKYSPNKKYSVTFGLNKENNHQLVVIDLDDQEKISNGIN
ncbi:Uncharacterised protein [uncultured archaeon]|nr:Uncharacterised protein [uncultured archaeon]